jgi:hypothetical protein
MARPTEAEMVQLGPWPRGVNNVAREDAVPSNALRAATNVDLTAQGKVQRRAGYDRVYVSTIGTRSLWSDGTTAIFAEGTELKSLSTAYAATVLAGGLHPASHVSYADISTWLYYSDGFVSGRVDLSSMTSRPWALNTPGGCAAVPSAAGGLDAGDYLVTIAYRTAGGELSGAPIAQKVTVVQGGGVTLTFSTPTQAEVSHVRAYISGANGAELRYHSEVAVGTTTMTLGVMYLGAELPTYLLQPMPACEHIALFNGRLFGAHGQYLFFSKPYFYGLYHPANGFITFPYTVDMLASVSMGNSESGLLVGSGERTYYLSGAGPDKFDQKVVYPRGVVPGSLTYVPGSAFDPTLQLGTDLLPVWLATNGVLCVGAPGGRVQPLTEGRFVTAIHERAAGLFRERNGIRQLVMTGISTVDQPLATADTPVTTTVQNGL